MTYAKHFCKCDRNCTALGTSYLILKPMNDICQSLRGCLYESQDGTFAGTGHCSGSRHVYVSIIFIAFRLYEAGTFFVPSRRGGISLSATGISLSATGIPPQAGRFLSYKCFIPPDRDKLNFSFLQFLQLFTQTSFHSILLFVLTLKYGRIGATSI